MKPYRTPLTRTTLRLKPGGILRLPPRFLKRSGWRLGDVLLVQVENAQLVLSRLPDERSWRINRLRRRIRSTADDTLATRSIRTLGDYRALSRERARRRHSSMGTLTHSKEN